MNNLLQIREKIKRANRLYEAQLLATKSGEVTPYRRSVFEERIRKSQKEMKLKDSKNIENEISSDNSNLKRILSDIFPNKKIVIQDNNDRSQTIFLS